MSDAPEMDAPCAAPVAKEAAVLPAMEPAAAETSASLDEPAATEEPESAASEDAEAAAEQDSGVEQLQVLAGEEQIDDKQSEDAAGVGSAVVVEPSAYIQPEATGRAETEREQGTSDNEFNPAHLFPGASSSNVGEIIHCAEDEAAEDVSLEAGPAPVLEAELVAPSLTNDTAMGNILLDNTTLYGYLSQKEMELVQFGKANCRKEVDITGPGFDC